MYCCSKIFLLKFCYNYFYIFLKAIFTKIIDFMKKLFSWKIVHIFILRKVKGTIFITDIVISTIFILICSKYAKVKLIGKDKEEFT